MHLLVMLMVVAAAWLIRCQPLSTRATWSERWYKSLYLLLFPVLLILITAIAILYMGCHGAMLGISVGFWGCAVSGSIILFALGCLIRLIYQSKHSIARLDIYPQQTIGDTTARVIEYELPYSAQIGFWQPELVVSRGLLNTLDKEHLDAVLAHEQAHLYYRDTFWFFLLGWVKTVGYWLPNTEKIWQELLLLRELRADSKAAEKKDFLLLAESLLTVAKAPLESSACSAGFNDHALGDRLSERIDFLLAQTQPDVANDWQDWSWLYLLFLPLLTISLHS